VGRGRVGRVWVRREAGTGRGYALMNIL